METSKWKQLCAGLLVGAMLLPVISNVAVHAEETASFVPNATIAARDDLDVPTNQWIQSGSKWWYKHADGSYTTNDFERINGSWYYFASSGYMKTGWQWIDGTWYYFASSGRMETGWQYIGGTWYYLTSSGSMVTGWKWINGDCYYFYGNGAMAADTWIDGSYVNGSGKWDSSASDNHETNKPEPTDPPATEEPKPTDPPATEEPKPTECSHDWKTVNHPEEGHWYSDVVCACGARFKTDIEWLAHVKSIAAGPNPGDAVLYHASWHDDTEWIVDKPAWSETFCTKCGAHK